MTPEKEPRILYFLIKFIEKQNTWVLPSIWENLLIYLLNKGNSHLEHTILINHLLTLLFKIVKAEMFLLQNTKHANKRKAQCYLPVSHISRLGIADFCLYARLLGHVLMII